VSGDRRAEAGARAELRFEPFTREPSTDLRPPNARLQTWARELARASEPRKLLTEQLQVEVFRRDSYLCSYCGVCTVPAQILELLGLPFTRGWALGKTHKAFPLLSTAASTSGRSAAPRRAGP
jgi:hypothetical protein